MEQSLPNQEGAQVVPGNLKFRKSAWLEQPGSNPGVEWFRPPMKTDPPTVTMLPDVKGEAVPTLNGPVADLVIALRTLLDDLDLDDVHASLSINLGVSQTAEFADFHLSIPALDFSTKYSWKPDTWRPDPETDLTICGDVESNPGPPKKIKKSTPKVVEVVKVVKAKARKGPPSSSSSGSAGKQIGSKVGGWLGDMAQKAIATITGFGDYTVSKNSLVANGSVIPDFLGRDHYTTVRHKEFIMNINSVGAAFNLTAFPINPTAILFPWLSEIALSFEQFRVRGMVICFKSTSATAVSSTNTALGSVILATQYNVLAPPFINQTQMEAYEFCTSCNPSQSMLHPIECDPGITFAKGEFFVEHSTTGDPRLENLGTLYVATVGQQAASQVGELWVSYEIDLIRPKLYNGVANLGLTSRLNGTGFSYNYLPATCMSPLASSTLDATSDFSPSFNLSSLNQISYPGWLSGTFYARLIYYVSSISGTPLLPPGAVTVSGHGTILQSALPTIGGTGINGETVTYSNAFTGSNQSAFLFAEMFFRLPGDQPGIPVVFQWQLFSSGLTATVIGATLMVSSISIQYP